MEEPESLRGFCGLCYPQGLMRKQLMTLHPRHVQPQWISVMKGDGSVVLKASGDLWKQADCMGHGDMPTSLHHHSVLLQRQNFF